MGDIDGGDPVCWLESVCTVCGALVEAPLPVTFWRCGARVGEDAEGRT